MKIEMTRTKLNQIYLGDCLELMPKHIDDKSVDMVFCDLPYGVTQNKWDSVIPLDKLWKEYKRVIKDNGAIVLFSAQPFTSVLVSSNLKMFKYEWVWNKVVPTNHLNAKRQPMRLHENICVFYKKQCTYNRQMTDKPKEYQRPNRKLAKDKFYETKNYGAAKRGYSEDSDYTKTNPKTIVKFSNGNGWTKKGHHPTQKPLSLIEYMILTYTNEGDLILDNACGSGTTGLGAKNLNRNYIMMEKDPEYYKIACKRLM